MATATSETAVGPAEDGYRRKPRPTTPADSGTAGPTAVISTALRASLPLPVHAMAIQRAAGNRALGTRIPRPVQRQAPPPSAPPGPTYGNMPRDPANPTVERFELRLVNGKWREVHQDARGIRRARGSYAFVIQDGRINAVRLTRIMGRPGGHTEAAQGARVSWAGEIRFNGKGQLVSWDDGSGHYRPASSLRQTAINAGLPADRWVQHPETSVRPRGGNVAPQLPVEQPATRSRDGSKPKIPAGPSRIAELEARRPKPESAPPTATAPTAKTTATPKAAPAVRVKGDATINRVSISYDSAAADKSRSISLRGLNLKDYPPDRPGRITGFFKDRPLVTGLAAAAASSAAGAAVDEAFTRIEAHFARAATRALARVNSDFPPVKQVLDDFRLTARGQVYDEVMRGSSRTTKQGRLGANMSDLFEYQDALNDAIQHLHRASQDSQLILQDLGQRSSVLHGVANSLEETFAWIQLNVPVLFAYYQSFVLWRARGVFLNLSARVDQVSSLLSSRVSDYQATFQVLSTRLATVDEEVGDLRSYADRLERTLKPRGPR